MPKRKTALARRRQFIKKKRLETPKVNLEAEEEPAQPTAMPESISQDKTQAKKPGRKSKIGLREISESPHSVAVSRKIPDRNSSFPKVKGRRLLTVESINFIVQKAFQHGKTCQDAMGSINISDEQTSGLQTIFSFSCSCGHSFSESNDMGRITVPVNDAAVWAAHTSGTGYSTLKSIMQVFEVHMMGFPQYQQCENRTHNLFQNARMKHLLQNGLEEHKLAEEAGDISVINGENVVCTTVQVDGGWAKRSYGHGYNSSSGVGVIIGMRTKKILWMSTRNKNCYQCTVNLRTGKVKSHECFKNWTGSSPGMETDIILEGFRNSIKMHKLIYSRMIGDGDSSVFADVEYIYPGLRVEKIECVNHFMRNLTSKIYNIAQNKITGRNAPKIPKPEQVKVAAHRDKITIGIRKAIEHNSRNRPITSTQTLIEDLDNVLSHVFGDHHKCKEYFCEKKTIGDPMRQIRKCAFYKPLQDAINRGITLAPRLIHNCLSNDAEHFMSLCSKFTSGKRVYYSHRGGYNMRMISAMFAFDDSCFWPEMMYRTIYNSNPTTPWTSARTKALQQKSMRKKFQDSKPHSTRKLYSSKNSSQHTRNTEYGVSARDADIDENILHSQIQKLHAELQVDNIKQAEVENETRSQSDSSIWFSMRRERITASNAKRVFRLQDSTNNKSILDTLLYPTNLDHVPSIKYGRDNEHKAIRKYEKMKQLEVSRCGLFISLQNGVFAASPDGLVGDDGSIEVKCPVILDGKSPELYATLNCKSPFIRRNKKTMLYEVVKSHQYYYQIIMMLHVTERSWCDLMVWSTGPKVLDPVTEQEVPEDPDGLGLILRIHKDKDTEELWRQMQIKFVKFWFEEMAPELVDARKIRNMPYRRPLYRTLAIAEKNKKKQSKDTKDVNLLQPPKSVDPTFDTVQVAKSSDQPSSSNSANLRYVPPPTYYDDSD